MKRVNSDDDFINPFDAAFDGAQADSTFYLKKEFYTKNEKLCHVEHVETDKDSNSITRLRHPDESGQADSRIHKTY